MSALRQPGFSTGESADFERREAYKSACDFEREEQLDSLRFGLPQLPAYQPSPVEFEPKSWRVEWWTLIDPRAVRDGFLRRDDPEIWDHFDSVEFEDEDAARGFYDAKIAQFAASPPLVYRPDGQPSPWRDRDCCRFARLFAVTATGSRKLLAKWGEKPRDHYRPHVAEIAELRRRHLEAGFPIDSRDNFSRALRAAGHPELCQPTGICARNEKEPVNA